ncbi:hypothetical protein CAPTEDRAFT_140485 [Capitella teleta]|uniref:G-protein coupled receptors family 1 profile domain-containing protein n=1 Tax=Capitella teleta TaxID=283909 RepID=R7VBU6_CAPTE|nr:hypothetical protein CAPTEDRAFT_140485 [Capitella teleta]|eukprot:ELU16099.1 hypothetical protein CAPTEDRAFT_140485 [Capitella teleta]
MSSVCKIIGVESLPVIYVHSAAILCSHFHILAVSMDRYVAIFCPLRYEGIMTSRVSGISIVWMAAGLFWLLVGLRGNIKLEETNYAVSMLIIFLFYAILVTVLILYVRIAVIAYRQNRKINDQATTPGNRISRATRTLASILGCYYFFWLPYFSVSSYIILFNYNEYHASEVLVATAAGLLLFASFNSIANVFVYAFGTKAYREWICAKCNCK